MLKLAYFSPLPPAPTGIADYSRELITPLSQFSDITLFTPAPAAVDSALRALCAIQPSASFPHQRWKFDLALYHMGNSGTYHADIYRMALRYPGIVVLHEVFLPDFIAHVTIGRGDHAAYAREIGYAMGAEGYEQAWQIRLGRRSGPDGSLLFSRRLVDRSLGIIVHSQSAAGAIDRPESRRPITVVPQLVASQAATSLRGRLDLPERTVIFATTGLVSASKRLDLALDAFARLKITEPDVFFLVVGAAHSDVNIPKMIRARDLQNHVYCTGRVDSLQEFIGWTAAADVVVTLRHPTLGEASNAAARALAAGKPLIVYDDGWYGELPDRVCRKVRPLDGEALTDAMSFMMRQPGARQEMGEAAAAYARVELNPTRVARQYESFMVEVLQAVQAPEYKSAVR